jgi:hypothetical protein
MDSSRTCWPPLKSLPDEEIRLAGEGMSEYMKNSLVQALLFKRNQTIISRDRLCYFKDHLNMCGDNYLLKTIPDATDFSGPPPSTPADNLLHALAKDLMFPMLPSMASLNHICLL